MAETPKHTDQGCSPEVPLSADDGCDRNHVIGIGCVSHTEEETDGDDGEQSKHQLDCQCFTLRCSAPGGKAQDHGIAGTTIGAVDRGLVVAAVPGIVHFGKTIGTNWKIRRNSGCGLLTLRTCMDHKIAKPLWRGPWISMAADGTASGGCDLSLEKFLPGSLPNLPQGFPNPVHHFEPTLTGRAGFCHAADKARPKPTP